MKIEFNKVTWYSRLGSTIVFLLVMPLLAFYIGRLYNDTIDSLYRDPYVMIDVSKSKNR